MYPSVPFSALNSNMQAQIAKTVASMQSDYYDLRFNFNGAYAISDESGYHRLALLSWIGNTKYSELSAGHKVRVLKTIRDADDSQFIALIYGGQGLYNIGTFDEAPSFVQWDEARPACEWLKILKLDGPDAPSGDSCLDLEIEALEDPGMKVSELLELSTKCKTLEAENLALRADLQGTSKLLKNIRAMLI